MINDTIDLYPYQDRITNAENGAKIADQIRKEQRKSEAKERFAEQRDVRLVAGAYASVEQLSIIQQEIQILREYYNILNELYEEQVKMNEETKKELERNWRRSNWMTAIAIVSMLAAIISAIFPFIR